MCFVWVSEQTEIISPYSINWLVCITETECVYCAVRTGSLYIIQVTLCLESANNSGEFLNSLFPESRNTYCKDVVVYKCVTLDTHAELMWLSVWSALSEVECVDKCQRNSFHSSCRYMRRDRLGNDERRVCSNRPEKEVRYLKQWH